MPFEDPEFCPLFFSLYCLLQEPRSHGPASRQGAMVALTAAMGLRNLAGQNSFSSSMIMINLVAPAHAMGAVNGAPRCLTKLSERCPVGCCSSLQYLMQAGNKPLLGGHGCGSSPRSLYHYVMRIHVACVGVSKHRILLL